MRLLLSRNKFSSKDGVERMPLLGAPPDRPKRVLHPESPTTPLWRKLLFQFFDEFLSSPEGIRPSDCWELEDKYRSAVASKKLRALYSAMIQGKKNNRSSKALARAIVVMEWRGLVSSGLTFMAYVMINTSIPLTLFSLLNHVMEPTSYDLVTIYAHLIALYLLHLLARAVMQLGYFQGSQIEYRVISALRTLVFETAIRVPHDQVEDKKRIGEVTRMYEQETYMIGVAVAQVQTFLGRVLLLALEVYVLARVFDSIRFVVLAIFAALCAVYLLGELLTNYARGKWHEKSAARLNLVHECFKGIRMIKFNAWEKKIRVKMEHARTEENRSQKTYGFLTAALLAFDKNSTHVFSAVFFAALTAQSNSFTPAQVFTALILVDRIKNRIFGLMRLSASTISGIISLQNIDSYLRENQSEPQQATTVEINPRDPSTAVAITRECLTESSSNSEPHKALLANVNLIIQRGHLTVIHGRTGTGKSTLLRAMLKEVRPLYGDVFVTSDCRIAYCPQEPWLQTLSIRENILFGSAFNEFKYRCVLDACCLLEDLKMLPDGDATRVSPKSVNLSGGQKGRIALARACYTDADLYVLDCPFASVDAIVQSDVFRKCLVDLLWFKTVVLVLLDEPFSALDQASEARLLGVLEESFAHSTVFLITHCLDQVLKFDKIMMLEKGELVEFGSAEELASDPSSAFYEFLETTLLTF